MRSAITVTEAAEWLFEARHGLSILSTDEGLAQRLADVMIERGHRLGQAPHDFVAIRAEVRRLWAEHERVGRSRECRRYHPDLGRRG